MTNARRRTLTQIGLSVVRVGMLIGGGILVWYRAGDHGLGPLEAAVLFAAGFVIGTVEVVRRSRTRAGRRVKPSTLWLVVVPLAAALVMWLMRSHEGVAMRLLTVCLGVITPAVWSLTARDLRSVKG
jgi:hypothetical protein